MKITMAALLAVVVRDAFTNAWLALTATERLKIKSFGEVNRSVVNSGLVPVVENW